MSYIITGLVYFMCFLFGTLIGMVLNQSESGPYDIRLLPEGSTITHTKDGWVADFKGQKVLFTYPNHALNFLENLE